MGESRKRDLNDRELAFSKTDRCIFCGGLQEATTVDHCPPRSAFSERRWPEGYVFPSCFACNSGSRLSENWIAVLARIHSQHSPNDEVAVRELRKVARPIIKPGVLKSMLLSANQKRELARRANLQLPPGGTYAELALMAVPKEAVKAVREFAVKIAKALHFLHTGRIVPEQAAIQHHWFTNFSQLEGKIPDDIFTIPNNAARLHRAKVDLSDQFNYRYAIADNGELSMFTVWFRASFCIAVFVTFDPKIMASATAAAREALDAKRLT